MIKNFSYFVVFCLILLLLGCSHDKPTVTDKAEKSITPTATGTTQNPYEIGKQEAEVTIKQNKLGWKHFGEPQAHDALFKQILKDEYQIDLLIVAGCRVTEELLQNVKGYNEVMKIDILKHFGKDVLPLAEAKAKQQYEDNKKMK